MIPWRIFWATDLSAYGFKYTSLENLSNRQKIINIDAKYPNLKNVTNERRMRARFSILRQIPINNKKTKSILEYLRNHEAYIKENPEATKIDKIALKLALSSPKLFQLAYKLFK